MIGLVLLAQLGQPVPQVGACPLGYYTQGRYCVPAPRARQEAVQRLSVQCPYGWFSQGSYCVRDSL